MDRTHSFGYWLRRRRKALDLTQDELARQLGCAIGTLKKIETDERRPSKQLAERLADCLEIPTTERATFLKAARAELAVDQLAVAAPERPEAARSTTPLPTGTVTFLFTDIEGSTRLWERQPRAMEQALARHDTLLRASIAANSGVVVKSTGDGIHAVFARATDATHAALAAQRSLSAEAWGALGAVRVRIALHSGVTEPRDGDYFGPALNRIARLLAAGHGGQILLSLASAELVREHLPPESELHDLGTHRLKDLTSPEQIFQLVASDLPSDFPPLRTLDARPTNLPAQPTALIGREREIAEVCALLRRDDVRLVTLTGPGGTGKTRLALQAAAELLDDTRPTLLSQRESGPEGEGRFPDGVWFVNLAPISDPGLVATTIAHVLGVIEVAGKPIEESLRAFLRAKRTLLLLDNFEQVLDAAPLVAELLAAAPQLKVLVTSRAVLHLYGEHEFAVPPLALPDLAHLPPTEQLTQYEAVRLFIAQAQAAKADFAVTNANAPSVAEICNRLDGLPLAIELAAARIKLFPPEALLARLNQRLPFLTGGPRDLPHRQQTLRNTIEWSYNLLDTMQQALFARLGVFVGGWTLEAAAAVCDSDGDLGLDVLDGLQSLLDKSLVRQVEGPGGEPHFTMLETIREYALERLEASEEREALRRRHAVYFLTPLKAMEPQHLHDSGVRRKLALKVDNLRTALHWALDQHETEIALWIGTALYTIVGLSESLSGLEAALALGGLEDVSAVTSDIRDHALVMAGWTAAWSGQFDRAQAHFATVLAISKERGDWKAHTQRALGWVALQRGNLTDARNWVEQSLALCHEIHDDEGIAYSLYDLGHLTFVEGDLAQAELLLAQSLVRFQGQGDVAGVVRAHLSMGHVARARGQCALATARYRDSISYNWEHHPLVEHIIPAIEGLAGVLMTQGQAEHAARLLGAADSLRADFDVPLLPIDRAAYERDVAAVRAQLDEETFAAAWAAGQALTLEQAIAEALDDAAEAPNT